MKIFVAKREVKPYCSICAKTKGLEDMNTTHNDEEHETFFDKLRFTLQGI